MDEDLCFLPAVEQARLVRSGALSAREAVEAHLERIDAENPAVNAVVTVVGARALRDAAEADARRARGDRLGPLHGVPIAHKDLVRTAGIRTTFGSPIFAGSRARGRRALRGTGSTPE